MTKFTCLLPYCTLDHELVSRVVPPGEEKSDIIEYCYRCGLRMQTFRIQCLESVNDPTLGVFDCVPKGKIC